MLSFESERPVAVCELLIIGKSEMEIHHVGTKTFLEYLLLFGIALLLTACGGGGSSSGSEESNSADRSQFSEFTHALVRPGSDSSLDGSWLYVGETSETFSRGDDTGTYSGEWFEGYSIVENGDTIGISDCHGFTGPKLYSENDDNVILAWDEEEFFGVNSNNTLLDFGTNEFDIEDGGMVYVGQSTTALVKLSNIINSPIGILNVDDVEIEISCVMYANVLETDFNGDHQPWYQAIFKSVDGEYTYFLNEDVFSIDFNGKVISITFEDESTGIFTFN